MESTAKLLQLRVPASLKKKIESLATQDHRSLNSMAVKLLEDAINDYLVAQEVAAALKEYRKGGAGFSSVEELRAKLGLPVKRK